MYKVFVNQDVIILTSVVPFGKKINLYVLYIEEINGTFQRVKWIKEKLLIKLH